MARLLYQLGDCGIIQRHSRNPCPYICNRFKKRGIDVKTNTAVKSFHSEHEDKFVILGKGDDTERISIGLLVWSAGLEPVKFVQSSFSQCRKGPGGRLVVDDYLMVQTDRNGKDAASDTGTFFYPFC
mmetsp:Transcript_3694/g.4996  ORF Transcript_3694/g.4996 Transcript_3694/m.4996 type:complete len:127 (+) Transcript_3694:39-419(+)